MQLCKLEISNYNNWIKWIENICTTHTNYTFWSSPVNFLYVMHATAEHRLNSPHWRKLARFTKIHLIQTLKMDERTKFNFTNHIKLQHWFEVIQLHSFYLWLWLYDFESVQNGVFIDIVILKWPIFRPSMNFNNIHFSCDISQIRGNRHTLTIRNVTYNDLGNYTCQASNTLGKDRASLTLSGIPSVCVFDSVSIYSIWIYYILNYICTIM